MNPNPGPEKTTDKTPPKPKKIDLFKLDQENAEKVVKQALALVGKDIDLGNLKLMYEEMRQKTIGVDDVWDYAIKIGDEKNNGEFFVDIGTVSMILTLESAPPKYRLREPQSIETDIKKMLRKYKKSVPTEEVIGESDEYGKTPRITKIEQDNLVGGAPGKIGKKRTAEQTKKAVEAIYNTFKPKTVVTLETDKDYDDSSEFRDLEKEEWEKRGVTVIQLPVEETEMNKLFEEDLEPETRKAFAALNEGKTYVHCTHGLHRAIAFIEIWRATKGFDRSAELKKKKQFDTSDGHKKCREQALELIEKELPSTRRRSLSEDVGSILEPTEETPATVDQTAPQEVPTQAFDLTKELQEEIDEIPAETRTKDEETVRASSIQDIRFDTKLLTKEDNKIKKEMRHRLAQYTEKTDDGGLRLNYLKFNKADTDHERDIGLGDIMPPEFRKVLVLKTDGTYHIGERTVVNFRGEDRVGYKDKNTGEYLSTFTGDIVYILEPGIKEEKKLAEIVKTEDEARKVGVTQFRPSIATGGGTETTGGYTSGETDIFKSTYERTVAQIESMKEPDFDYDVVVHLGSSNSSENKKRSKFARMLAKKKGADIFLTGGTKKGKTISEAEEAKQAILDDPDSTVEEGAIDMETQSTSTGGNVKYALPKLKAKGYKKILVVSNAGVTSTHPKGHAKGAAEKFKRLLPGVEVAYFDTGATDIDKQKI